MQQYDVDAVKGQREVLPDAFFAARLRPGDCDVSIVVIIPLVGKELEIFGQGTARKSAGSLVAVLPDIEKIHVPRGADRVQYRVHGRRRHVFSVKESARNQYGGNILSARVFRQTEKRFPRLPPPFARRLRRKRRRHGGVQMGPGAMDQFHLFFSPSFFFACSVFGCR